MLEDNVFHVSYQSADYGLCWLLYNTRCLLCGKRSEWFVRQQQIIKMKFGIWKQTAAITLKTLAVGLDNEQKLDVPHKTDRESCKGLRKTRRGLERH